MRLAALLIAFAAGVSTVFASGAGRPCESNSTAVMERPRAPSSASLSDRHTAAELRSLVLYSDGEFSTFWHPSRGLQGAFSETATRRAPLDRQTNDAWIAMDKAKHLSFSFLWTLGTQYVVVNKGRISEYRALPISITSSALIGVTKEYYDLQSGPPHVFSYKDLAANAVGIALAAGLILL